MKTATVLTSSCNPSKIKEIDFTLNEVFSTNWGFKFNVPITYYTCATPEKALLDDLIKSKFCPNNWILTQNVLTYLKEHRSLDFTKTDELFSRLRSIGKLGKKHMRSFKEREGLNLPTSGAQLIYLVSSFNFKNVDILGVNLYTQRVDGKKYKFFGNTALENPYQSKEKPHDFGTDFEFIYDSFIRMKLAGTEIQADSEILIDLLAQIDLGSPKEKIKSNLIKKFYFN